MRHSHLIEMMKFTNYLIQIFKNNYESIRDKRKLVEKLRRYTFKITYISTANYRRLQNLVPN